MYLLFVSNTYYPNIGFDDYHSRSESLDEAVRFFNANLESLKIVQLVDLVNKKKITVDVPATENTIPFRISVNELNWEDI